MLEIWPNFFIVGAGKSGTTSLYAYLKDTPGIYMSAEKEPRYFHEHNVDVYLARPEMRISNKTKYLKLFQNAKNEKVIGEASPSYLRDPETPKLIHNVVPDAKIIILLRDPVERAFSNYLMRRSNGQEKRTFHDMILDSLDNRKKDDKEYNLSLDPGLYVNQVKRYLDMFGTKNVRIWTFEEFIEKPKKIVKDILEFLEIDSHPPDSIGKTFNPYGTPRGKIGQYIVENRKIIKLSNRLIPQNIRWRLKQDILLKREKKPILVKEDRLILEDFYREDVKKLQILLNREFPWGWYS